MLVAVRKSLKWLLPHFPGFRFDFWRIWFERTHAIFIYYFSNSFVAAAFYVCFSFLLYSLNSYRKSFLLYYKLYAFPFFNLFLMYRGNFSFGNFFHPSSCCILKSQISEGRRIQYFFHVEFNLHLALYEGKINFFSKLLNFSSFLASFNGRFFSLRYYQMNLASLYTFFASRLFFFVPRFILC